MNENLFTLIKANMPDGQKTLITDFEGGTVTYRDMLNRSGQYANVLKQLGIQPDDRVAVQIEKSIDGLWLYLACLRVGAVFLPLNVGYTEVEIDYFIADSEPSLFVCRPETLDAAKRIADAHGVSHVETLGGDGTGSLTGLADSADSQFEDAHRSADDLAAILYTSGTTGKSKGAMITHHNLSSNAAALASYWKFSRDDVLLHALPIFHTHGLFVATNVTLMAGASMIFLTGFDLDAVLSQLPKSTVMMGVPTFYVRLLSSKQLTSELVSHMRLFISGSAPLSPQTHKEFEARTGHAILERYGMTETNMNTSNPYDGTRRPGTVGFALPGVEIRIADPDKGTPLDDGEIGVIEVRGPNVFRGYWRLPEKTRAEFRDDGFFITGDLGLIDEWGYLNIVGREKDLIISGGYNVYPAEIENTLDAVPGIAESAVIGLPHPDFGEGVTAVVVPKNGAGFDPEIIREELSGRLARYKMPKRIISVDALPRNKMGKVQKALLRDQYKEIFSQ